MAIFSMCSDIETQQIRWVERNIQTDEQRPLGQMFPPEAAFFAGCCAEKYQQEALDKIPTFEWH